MIIREKINILESNFEQGGNSYEKMKVGSHRPTKKIYFDSSSKELSVFGRYYFGQGDNGSFVDGLLNLFKLADYPNKKIIIQSWPEYFNDYDLRFKYYKEVPE